MCGAKADADRGHMIRRNKKRKKKNSFTYFSQPTNVPHSCNDYVSIKFKLYDIVKHPQMTLLCKKRTRHTSGIVI